MGLFDLFEELITLPIKIAVAPLKALENIANPRSSEESEEYNLNEIRKLKRDLKKLLAELEK